MKLNFVIENSRSREECGENWGVLNVAEKTTCVVSDNLKKAWSNCKLIHRKFSAFTNKLADQHQEYAKVTLQTRSSSNQSSKKSPSKLLISIVARGTYLQWSFRRTWKEKKEDKKECIPYVRPLPLQVSSQAYKIAKQDAVREVWAATNLAIAIACKKKYTMIPMRALIPVLPLLKNMWLALKN